MSLIKIFIIDKITGMYIREMVAPANEAMNAVQPHEDFTLTPPANYKYAYNWDRAKSEWTGTEGLEYGKNILFIPTPPNKGAGIATVFVVPFADVSGSIGGVFFNIKETTSLLIVSDVYLTPSDLGLDAFVAGMNYSTISGSSSTSDGDTNLFIYVASAGNINSSSSNGVVTYTLTSSGGTISTTNVTDGIRTTIYKKDFGAGYKSVRTLAQDMAGNTISDETEYVNGISLWDLSKPEGATDKPTDIGITFEP